MKGLLLAAAVWLVAVLAGVEGQTRGRTIIIPLPKDASGGDVYPDCNKGN